jgi:hypothetical protein
LGTSLKLGETRIEASIFHGEEPEPTKVDLPLGTPDSGALRIIQEFNPSLMAMGSVSYISHPEPHDPDIVYEMRYSASAYYRIALSKDWTFYNTFIFGAVTHYDHASVLNSFAEEFWFTAGAPNFWGRIEVLQRTAGELGIDSVAEPNSGRWVSAMTLGYTHYFAHWEGATLGIGGALTKNFLPADFSSAYDGNPWAAKVFLQLKGMRMWEI